MYGYKTRTPEYRPLPPGALHGQTITLYSTQSCRVCRAETIITCYKENQTLIRSAQYCPFSTNRGYGLPEAILPSEEESALIF